MKIYRLVAMVAIALLAACSPAQDTQVQTTLTKINGAVADVKAKVMAQVQKTCPNLVNAAVTIEAATAIVAAAIGLPATGTAVVGLETAVVTGCQALLAKANLPPAN